MDGERNPYGRHVERAVEDGRRDGAGPFRRYGGETYYDRPAIKETHYGWLIASYLFLGGLAGASQLIASVADLAGDERQRPVVRAGRYLAALGSMVCPALLIADLQTPQRWYNMLRIFRRTSAMSIGSWTLFAFGTLSGLTALGQVAADAMGSGAARRLASAIGLPAALAGAVMSTYTGVLLSATSIPLWASASRRLPALFGLSAASTATAAISLGLSAAGRDEESGKRLEALALAAGAGELALSLATQLQWKREGVGEPLERGRLAEAHRFGVMGLGIAVPLAIESGLLLSGRRSRAATMAAALATLAGGYILRAVLVFAGNESAQRPKDYFAFTEAAGKENGW